MKHWEDRKQNKWSIGRVNIYGEKYKIGNCL